LAGYFFDSSALVKLYHPEPGTPVADRIVNSGADVVRLSRPSVAEIISAFAIKARMKFISHDDARTLVLRFRGEGGLIGCLVIAEGLFCSAAVNIDDRALHLPAPSFRRRLAGFCLNGADIVETEGLSADAPGAAFHFLNDDPGGIPQAVTDERYDGFGDVVNEAGRLGSRQFFLKYLDGYEWHRSLLFEFCLDLPALRVMEDVRHFSNERFGRLHVHPHY
jgi:hypothetical protein